MTTTTWRKRRARLVERLPILLGVPFGLLLLVVSLAEAIPRLMELSERLADGRARIVRHG